MIVGESPGRDEVRTGTPFTGKSGSILDQCLEASGMPRESCYITNAVKYLPRGEKKKFFFTKGQPTETFMDGILELVEEVNEVRPRAILAFGNYALWALTQQAKITSKRGYPMRTPILPEAIVVPAIHPAWYLRTRQFQKLPMLEWDIAKAVRYAKEGYTPPEKNFLTNPSEKEIMDIVSRMEEADVIAVDTEWYSPNVFAYVGFADSITDAATIIPKDEFSQTAIRRILSNDTPKVMQNAMFDVVALDRQGYEVRNVVHDTMVAWHWCWTRLGEKSLNVLGSILTDRPYYKDEIEFVGDDDVKGQEYCCTDCVVTLESMERIQEKEFPTTGGKKGYEISMSIMPEFLEAGKRGILVDRKEMRRLRDFHEGRADKLEKHLADILNRPGFNCRSPKQVSEVIYDDIGIPGRTKRTSAQDVLMDIAASETREDVKEVLTAIIRVRQDRNIVSRYLKEENIVDSDGRARANWNLASTLSGRLSTTKPWWPGVPLQTVPIDARGVYVADPGHVFIGWDDEQAEARYVAAETRDYDLLDAMESGKDIHSMLAPILGLTYEDIMELLAEAKEKDIPKDKVRERYLLKKCRHQLNYVSSWVGLKRSINREFLDTGIGVTAAEAKDLEAGYLRLNPGLESWWQEIYMKVSREKYLVNSFGRRVNFFEHIRKRDNTHRSAVSFRPQSSISDKNTIAIAKAAERMRGWGEVMLHAHDGGVFQVPEERVDDAEEIIREEMVMPIRAGNMQITIPIEVKRGYNWKEMD